MAQGSDGKIRGSGGFTLLEVLVAMALFFMAVLCFYWQQYSDMPLLDFALSVMVFSYSGLLGVRNNKKRVKTIFFTCTVALDGFTLCV